MKSLVVIGAGALGSQVVPLLRNVGAEIKVIDFDRVEAKNVQSQFHGKPNIGKLKTLSLQATVNLLFGQKIESAPQKLVEDNVYQLVGAPSLVVDCLDNAASRRVVQAYVRKDFIGRHGLPCLHGAVDANGSFGRVVWDEMFVIDEEDGEGAPTCENGEHLPFLTIVAAHLAHAAKEFLKNGARLGYQISPGGTVRI